MTRSPIPRAVPLIACLAFAARLLSAQSPDPDPLAGRLDRMFHEVDSATTPGCVVGVAREGLPALVRSYGVADLERPTPFDPATIFEAGSVSKQFTAAAVLLLSLEGKLSLDDDVRRWIPEFPAEGPRITVRQLLQHQSGLRDYGDIVELSGWPRGTRAYQADEIAALIARQRQTNFAPGAEYSYSNSNYVIAVAIVARASGESFPAYTRRAIFAPLGMTSTQWRDDFTRLVPGRATGWSPDDDDQWRLDMPFENVVGHAGLLTTVPDLLRWQANFAHPIIGGPGFAGEMERAGVLSSGRVTGYALGLEVGTERGARVISHGGWTAGYKTYVGRAPDHGLAVALLCNAGSLRTDRLGPQLLAVADGDTSVAAGESEPELGPAATEAGRLSIAGLYRNRRTRQPVRARAFRDGITLNSWVGYGARTADSFASMDGRNLLTVDRAGSARVSGFRIAYPGGDTIRYDRMAEWAPTAAERRRFAGSYTSGDAGATWTLEVAHDTLFVVRRVGQRDAMIPSYGDAFQVPSQGWLVTFRRDRTGRVTGLEVGTTRMRTMPFSRTAVRTPASR